MEAEAEAEAVEAVLKSTASTSLVQPRPCPSVRQDIIYRLIAQFTALFLLCLLIFFSLFSGINNLDDSFAVLSFTAIIPWNKVVLPTNNVLKWSIALSPTWQCKTVRMISFSSAHLLHHEKTLLLTRVNPHLKTISTRRQLPSHTLTFTSAPPSSLHFRVGSQQIPIHVLVLKRLYKAYLGQGQ